MPEEFLKSTLSAKKIFHDLMGFLQATALILDEVDKNEHVPHSTQNLARSTLTRMNELLPQIRYYYQLACRDEERGS